MDQRHIGISHLCREGSSAYAKDEISCSTDSVSPEERVEITVVDGGRSFRKLGMIKRASMNPWRITS
jgi:hypothetical protein